MLAIDRKRIPWALLIGMISIIALDQLTKWIAFVTLPFEQTIPVSGERIYFFLTYNREGLGSTALALFQSNRSGGDPFLLSILVSLSYLIISIYLLVAPRMSVKNLYKIIWGLLLFFLLNVAVNFIVTRTSFPLELSQKFRFLRPLGFLSLLSVLLYYAKKNRYRWPLAIMLASGLSNLLDNLHPPYYVIDFFYVDILYRFIKFGIGNVADYFYAMGLILLLLNLFLSLIVSYRSLILIFKDRIKNDL